jgi:hypothetical protein
MMGDQHNHAVRVDELLRRPAGRGLTLVAGPWDARDTEAIVVVETPAGIERCGRGAVALLTRGASTGFSGADLESALRRSGELELAALATYGPPTASVGPIAAAASARVALLAVPADRDVSELAHDLERALRADADAALRRLLAAVAVVGHAERAGVDAVLSAASRALGTELRLTAEPAGDAAAAVVVAGRRESYVHAAGDDPEAAIACRIVADAVARVRAAEAHSESARLRTSGRVLAEIVAAADGDLARLAERARAADLAVDGDHAAVALRPANVSELTRGDATAGAELTDELVRIALRTADRVDPTWHAVRRAGAIVLVRTTPAGPTPPRGGSAAAAAALEGVLERYPRLVVHCGASGPHRGIAGLRAAAAEAAQALANARSLRRSNVVVPAEASGLHRLLVEWTSSSEARAAVARMLAPLEALGPRRAHTAVRTLQVYLDERGSLKRAGQALHLHRNAVAYRIRRIAETLDADLDDADQRLALQLACRAWLLARA